MMPDVNREALRRLLKTARAKYPELWMMRPCRIIIDALGGVSAAPLLARQGSFELPDAGSEWRAMFEGLKDDEALLQPIKAVGRINGPGVLSTMQCEDKALRGTGWLVREQVVVSNRHVVEKIVDDVEAGTVEIDFLGEAGATTKRAFTCDRAWFPPYDQSTNDDVGFLRLATATGDITPIELADDPATPGTAICAIGYPSCSGEDSPEVADLLREFFKGVFAVKRLSPGNVLAPPQDPSHLNHDCTTLGGSSGSVLLDLRSRKAIGLNFNEHVLNIGLQASVVRRYLETSPVKDW